MNASRFRTPTLASLVAVALGGCDSILGIEDTSQCDSRRLAYDYGQLPDGSLSAAEHLVVGFLSSNAIYYLFRLGPSDAADRFTIRLNYINSDAAPFPTGPVEGTFSLDGAQSSLSTCGACVYAFADITDTGDFSEYYVAESGSLVLDDVRPGFVGSLRDVVLRQTSRNNLTPDEEGCISTIERFDFEFPTFPPVIQTAAWTREGTCTPGTESTYRFDVQVGDSDFSDITVTGSPVTGQTTCRSFSTFTVVAGSPGLFRGTAICPNVGTPAQVDLRAADTGSNVTLRAVIDQCTDGSDSRF